MLACEVDYYGNPLWKRVDSIELMSLVHLLVKFAVCISVESIEVKHGKVLISCMLLDLLLLLLACPVQYREHL